MTIHQGQKRVEKHSSELPPLDSSVVFVAKRSVERSLIYNITTKETTNFLSPLK